MSPFTVIILGVIGGIAGYLCACLVIIIIRIIKHNRR